MSSVPVYADSEELVTLLRDKSKVIGKDYVVIDVRDKDFEGGNIPGAINVPAGTLLDNVDTLITEYSKVPVVYFHCALSQVRGPKSARIYKESLSLRGYQLDQEIKVLRGGFEGWQAKYKNEKDLIENYNPAFWAEEFF
ncbi:hypothetical protein EC973_008731 [Apophysomyces ossiformis]|uniref:Rhodanese domain-containing protein n=1 Tax=Apophysomyces ossiformis TaxID=679940 RepID=A0A8H7BMW9_9FUNG|nr:hypothetical protein EC973_008731 [Apophysomyces ossiformis]